MNCPTCSLEQTLAPNVTVVCVGCGGTLTLIDPTAPAPDIKREAALVREAVEFFENPPAETLEKIRRYRQARGLSTD